MTIREFTNEEIQKLKQSEYVVAINSKYVYFSAEFKKRFFNEYQSGKKPKKILTDMGIDTSILGQSRVNGIKRHIMEDVESGKGFTDITESPQDRTDGLVTPEEQIKRLEHELAYVRQENEFLKKIVALYQEEEET